MKKLLVFISFLFISAMSCSEKQDTLSVSTHPADWVNSNSPAFHGKAVIQNGLQSCQSCHGQDYLGGTSQVSCYGCHAGIPHPVGFADPSSNNFHGEFLRTVLEWDLSECRDCHGMDYSGGSTGISCTTSGCHINPDGPEACNTCHGNFASLAGIAQIAPPEDLNKNTSHQAIGVGAHQMHVAETEVTVPYACTTCHPDIINFTDPTHIDQSTATIIFSALATDNGRLTPVWDRNDATCSEVYCHGNFRFGIVGNPITGNSDPVVWTAQNPDPAACDFCHALPPTGHFGQGQYTTPGSCSQCHTSVVNSAGEIINTRLHINGQSDF